MSIGKDHRHARGCRLQPHECAEVAHIERTDGQEHDARAFGGEARERGVDRGHRDQAGSVQARIFEQLGDLAGELGAAGGDRLSLTIVR